MCIRDSSYIKVEVALLYKYVSGGSEVGLLKMLIVIGKMITHISGFRFGLVVSM